MKRGRQKKVVDAVPAERVSALVGKIEKAVKYTLTAPYGIGVSSGDTTADLERQLKQNELEETKPPVASSEVNRPAKGAIEPVRQQISGEIISKLVLDGDVSKMSAEQRVDYYNGLCTALGLNPLTRPFQLIKLNGKEVLYAAKDATDQLRKLNGVSITSCVPSKVDDVYVVTVQAQDRTGKTDMATGAVNIKGLAGDALANAIMKAETKSKRRVTLSICGLGVLDETELETIPGAVKNITPPHTDEPSQEIKDPLIYNMMQGTTGYGSKWQTLSTDVITKAHKYYSTDYKGMDGESMSAILLDILEERRLNDSYDPITNRYKGK